MSPEQALKEIREVFKNEPGWYRDRTYAILDQVETPVTPVAPKAQLREVLVDLVGDQVSGNQVDAALARVLSLYADTSPLGFDREDAYGILTNLMDEAQKDFGWEEAVDTALDQLQACLFVGDPYAAPKHAVPGEELPYEKRQVLEALGGRTGGQKLSDLISATYFTSDVLKPLLKELVDTGYVSVHYLNRVPSYSLTGMGARQVVVQHYQALDD